jgi:hypothetical protein
MASTLCFAPRGAWKTVVGQGSFAHNKTAAPSGAAVFRGETHHVPLKWSTDSEARTRESLLSAIMAFFKDNPGWE